MKEVKFISHLLAPESCFCPGYTDEEGKRHRVVVIIAPIAVEFEYEGETAKARISWGCSLGGSCFSRICRYSRAYQEMVKWAREEK